MTWFIQHPSIPRQLFQGVCTMLGNRVWGRIPILPGAIALAGLLALTNPEATSGDKGKTEEGFTPLFDGKSLEGWKASENVKSWKAEGGVIVCKGPRSHLFYVADPKPFKNFHLKVDVLTKP